MGCRSSLLGLLAVAIVAYVISLGTTGVVNGIGIGTLSLKSKYQREFDYFSLALQWAPTYCRRTRHCCSSNACCRRANAPTEFTIHGLWPNYNDGTWPACCTQKRFNEKEISPLIVALNKYWPSLSCGSPRTCHGSKGPFWAHEWEKHGTCSSPVVLDEYNYFLTVLNVYSKYNVTKVLNEAGFVASNSEKYPLRGVVTAIQNAFHTTPQVICQNGAIEELRLCFYKDFKPRECVTGSTSKNNFVSSSNSCPKYISIPQNMPSRARRAKAKTRWSLGEEGATEECSSM